MKVIIYFFFLIIAFVVATNEVSELIIWRGGEHDSANFEIPDIEYYIDQFKKIAETRITKYHLIYRFEDKNEVDKVLESSKTKENIQHHVLPSLSRQRYLWLAMKNWSRHPFIKQELNSDFIELEDKTTNLFFVIESHGDIKGNIRHPDFSGEDFADFINKNFKDNQKLKKITFIVLSCNSHLFAENLSGALDENLKKKVIIFETTSQEKKFFAPLYNYDFNIEGVPHQVHPFLNKEIFYSYEWPDRIENVTPVNVNNWTFSDLLENNHKLSKDQEGRLSNIQASHKLNCILGKDFAVKSEELFDFTPTTIRIRYYFQKNIIQSLTLTDILDTLDKDKLYMESIKGVDENSQEAIFHSIGLNWRCKSRKPLSFHSKLINVKNTDESTFNKEKKKITEFFEKEVDKCPKGHHLKEQGQNSLIARLEFYTNSNTRCICGRDQTNCTMYECPCINFCDYMKCEHCIKDILNEEARSVWYMDIIYKFDNN